MHDLGEIESFVDPSGKRRRSAAGAWKSRWAHWRGCSTRGGNDSNEPWTVGCVDSPYLRVEEERTYQRRLAHLIEYLRLYPR